MAYKKLELAADFEHTLLKNLSTINKQIKAPLFRFLRSIFTLLAIASFLYFIIGIFIWPNNLYVGLALVSLGFFAILEAYMGYFGFLSGYIKRLHFKTNNLVDFLTLDAYEEIKKYPQNIDSYNLALDLLKYPQVQLFLFRLEIDSKYLKNLLLKGGGTNINTQDLLQAALAFVISRDINHIGVINLFSVLMQKDPFLSNFLEENRIEENDLKFINDWFKQNKNGFFELRFTGGVARDWTVGYSPVLDQFSSNMAFTPLADWQDLAHKAKKEELKKSLLQNLRGNVLLIGAPGIGKRSMVIGLAKDLRDGKCPYGLAYKRILQINVADIITSGKDAAGIREIFGRVLREVLIAGDVLVYFDNLALLLGGGEALGRVNLIDLLTPYLQNPNFRIIASISDGDYDNYISRNVGLAQFFTSIGMQQPSQGENILILEGLALMYEASASIFFTYPALIRAIELSREYFWKEYLPLSAINFMQKVAQNASSGNKQVINKEEIEQAFAKITNIEVGEIKSEEKIVLSNLEQVLHKKIVDQAEPIKLLSEAIRIRRAGIKSSKKPIGSFLFLGPTGVGKTETAKALAATYFNKEESMIRFDMSEYQNREDIYRFIGDPKTMVPGKLTEAVKNNPFCVILLDEFEKANKDILNLFLQILDEGFLTDAFGAKVQFHNHLIIATSNAGSDKIQAILARGGDFNKQTVNFMNYLVREHHFTPELLNRFDKVVMFKPLGREEIYQIAQMKLAKLEKELYNLKRIKLEVEDDAVLELAKLGYNPQFGARGLERTIREKVESLVAKKIIEGNIAKNKQMIISREDIEKTKFDVPQI